jgi:hypothetical protein
MNSKHPCTCRFITAAHAARFSNGKRSNDNSNPTGKSSGGFGIDLAPPPNPRAAS